MAKRISIGTTAFAIGSYRASPVPIQEIIEKLVKLGFDGLELDGYNEHPNPEKWDTKELRQELRETWESRGMQCSGFSPDLWSERLITGSRESYVAAFKANAEFCNDLGIASVRVDTTEPPGILGPVPGEPPAERVVDYDDALRTVVSTWKECAKIAADAGLRIAWEFEPQFAFNKPSDIFHVLDGVGEDNFYTIFDMCHANTLAVHGLRQPGEPETLPGGVKELARRLTGKIGRVHLNDSTGKLLTVTSAHVPFGEGEIDFDEVMPAVVAAGCPDDWWTIDLCWWPDAWTAIERCKKFVDELNVKYG